MTDAIRRILRLLIFAAATPPQHSWCGRGRQTSMPTPFVGSSEAQGSGPCAFSVWHWRSHPSAG